VRNTETLSSTQPEPCLLADTVFIDVDDTMTVGCGAVPPEPPPLEALVGDLLDLPEQDAAKWVESAEARVTERVGRSWPFGVLEQAGATESQLWAALCRYFRARVRVPPDVMPLLRFLRERQIRVFTATTNPRLYALGKLSTGELANQEGSPYLTDCFGGEEVSVGGKCGPQFFRALLERTGANPHATVMIGDDRTADLSYARQAGIRQVVLVNRSQNRDWRIGPEAEVCVRDLAVLLPFWSG
jgi:FMN phosphatase YigB (HAD superfamily)